MVPESLSIWVAQYQIQPSWSTVDRMRKSGGPSCIHKLQIYCTQQSGIGGIRWTDATFKVLAFCIVEAELSITFIVYPRVEAVFGDGSDDNIGKKKAGLDVW
jgi:hypothetical protein